jgi:HSP20 family protein
MTKIVRWNRVDPFSLFNEFDRFFEKPLSRSFSNQGWGLAVDVAENEDGYIVKASVPGINPDELEITLEDNVLTLKGEVSADEEINEDQYHVRERRYGSFSRSVRFPVAVNGDDVEATYENGILTLNVPKAEEVKPRRIAIKNS